MLAAGCTEPVDSVIDAVAPPPAPTPIVETSQTSDERLDMENRWICRTVEVDARGATGDYRTMDPNSSVIWPGNLLQGATLSRGTPEVVNVARAGGVITTDLTNGSQGTQASVEAMTQANVIEAINDIVANNSGELRANFTYDFREVRSREEMALAMKVDVNTLTVDVDGQLSVNESDAYHSVLVDFVQKYFTISFETPTSYAGFFAPEVTGDDLAPFVGPDNPPVFIKSVTYGRRYYLLITSRARTRDIQASIRASYDAALTGGSLAADATYVKDLKDVQISVFALGGDAQRAAATFNGDFAAVSSFLVEGGNIGTGAPLSYTMETVARPHRNVGVSLATQFSVDDCQPAELPAFAEAWFGAFDGEGIGSVVATEANGDNTLLFNRAGTQYLQIVGDRAQGPFTLGDPSDTGRLAGCPIAPAGAAQGLNGQIRIFSEDGLSYVWNDLGSPDWGSVRDLQQWGEPDGNHPFLDPTGGSDAGIGAAFQSRDGPELHSIHFNRAGNLWVQAIDHIFTPTRRLDEWGGDSDYDLPFASVGAGARVEHDGKLVEVLFNGAGTEFIVFPDGDFPEVYQIGIEPSP